MAALPFARRFASLTHSIEAFKRAFWQGRCCTALRGSHKQIIFHRVWMRKIAIEHLFIGEMNA
jgi:hypothetical protein